MPIKDIAKELTLLLLFAVITAFVVNSYSSKGIALTGDWDKAQGVITAKAKDNVVNHGLEIQDIRIAKKIYDGKEAIFVDARAYEDYKDGHIKGAIALPFGEYEQFIDSFRDTYPASQHIITYCSGRECDDSHELAHHLFDAGFTNVSVFIDGYPAWEEEGYPVE